MPAVNNMSEIFPLRLDRTLIYWLKDREYVQAQLAFSIINIFYCFWLYLLVRKCTLEKRQFQVIKKIINLA